MTGKQKCAILRQIRRDIAAKNDILMTISECKHQGNCLGTCPKCESEVAALEKALDARRKSGKQVVIAGISAGLIAANCASCGDPFGARTELSGDIQVESTTSEETTAPDETGDELQGDIDVQIDEKPEIAGIIAAPETPLNDE